MLQIGRGQIIFYDYLLPKGFTTLNEELASVDEYLNDERFIQPFIKHFHRHLGALLPPLQVFWYNLSYANLVE